MYGVYEPARMIGAQDPKKFWRRAESQVWHKEAKLSQRVPESRWCPGWPCRAVGPGDLGIASLPDWQRAENTSRLALIPGHRWCMHAAPLLQRGELRVETFVSPKQIRKGGVRAIEPVQLSRPTCDFWEREGRFLVRTAMWLGTPQGINPPRRTVIRSALIT